jgi:HK97 family phage prohead protease
MENKETRCFEFRFDAESRQITGHGAVFNTETKIWDNFYETIDPGFFDDVLGDDVRALFNHNSNLVLGRTKSGTLQLSVDEKGLKYVIPEMPNTTTGNDLLELISRGDISQSSFSFSVKEDKWEKRGDGSELRTLLKCQKLYDVAPVTFPAYPTADVAKRSHDDFEKTQQEADHKESIHDDLAINYRVRTIKLNNLKH